MSITPLIAPPSKFVPLIATARTEEVREEAGGRRRRRRAPGS